MSNGTDIPHPNLEDQKAEGNEGRPSDFADEPKNRGKMFKKIGRFIKKVAKGEGFVGKVVFGVLDVIPFPNVHEIIKSVLKDPDVSFKDGAKMFVSKIDWTRTIIGVLLVVAFVMGWITVEDLRKIANALFGG